MTAAHVRDEYRGERRAEHNAVGVAALGLAQDGNAGVEVDVVDVQRRGLGQPAAREKHERDERVVAPTRVPLNSQPTSRAISSASTRPAAVRRVRWRRRIAVGLRSTNQRASANAYSAFTATR